MILARTKARRLYSLLQQKAVDGSYKPRELDLSTGEKELKTSFDDFTSSALALWLRLKDYPRQFVSLILHFPLIKVRWGFLGHLLSFRLLGQGKFEPARKILHHCLLTQHESFGLLFFGDVQSSSIHLTQNFLYHGNTDI